MRQKINLLQRECDELVSKVEDLENKIKFTKENENEKLEQENEKHRLEVEDIKSKNNRLKEDLQNMLEDKK